MTNPVRLVRETGILLTDGTRLSARVWLPESSETEPVPAVLEYIPYRKGDWSARGDSMVHGYFAEHGYAAVRVDIRGSGDSEGVLRDEYLAQEQQDACDVIAWIIAQPWCSGQVGMIGFSWGGFAALQVASLRPPGLEAIIPCHFTDNRYTLDAHHIGGTVLASEMLSWSTTMLAYLSLPPDPETVGSGWEDMWGRRLAAVEPPVHEWLAHQRYDSYWRHGSVCEDYAAIQCPVYAVGGMADSYVDSVPRLLEHLRGPKKGLIGAWAHYYPFAIDPGPRIGFLQECVRWWDRWLKKLDNGIMDEPLLQVWMTDGADARPGQGSPGGRWIAASSWPPEAVTTRRMDLTGVELREARPGERRRSGDTATREVLGSQASGLECGLWCPLGTPFDLPPDQRREDGMALAFTSPPLPEAIELLGYPRLRMRVASDRRSALVAVRLCEVSPDGASRLISRGILNLTHRDGHADPVPLPPGEAVDVSFDLKLVANTVASGHRLRLAMSPTYWPWAWPSPEPVRLSIHTATTVLELPIYDGRASESEPPTFEAPRFAEPVPAELVRSAPNDWRLTHDVATGRHDLEIRMAPIAAEAGTGRIRLLDTGLEIEELQHDRYSIVEDEPLSARVECHRSCELERGPWRVSVEARAIMTSDLETFHLNHFVEVRCGDITRMSRSWSKEVPRDHL